MNLELQMRFIDSILVFGLLWSAFCCFIIAKDAFKEEDIFFKLLGVALIWTSISMIIIFITVIINSIVIIQ